MANVLRDPEGNPLDYRSEPQSAPWYPIKDPVAQLPIKDDDLGVVHYLNDVFPTIEFANAVTKLRGISLRVISKNSLTSGTMLITPVIGGVDAEQIELTVTNAWVTHWIRLDAEDTDVVLRRDLGGTIDDGGMTTVAVKAVLWEEL